MRNAGIALGVLGAAGQFGITFMGYALTWTSAGVLLLLAADAVVALAGAVLAMKWRRLGAGLMLAAGLGAVVALFGTTLLEIGVAAFLVLAVAATLRGEAIRR